MICTFDEGHNDARIGHMLGRTSILNVVDQDMFVSDVVSRMCTLDE